MENQAQPCICADINPEDRIDLMNIHSGFSERDLDFKNRYNLVLPDVNLECMRCCLLYLKQGIYSISEGSLDIVTYPRLSFQPGIPLNIPTITGFLNIPTGVGRKGQTAIGHDLNLGSVSARAFANSRTYQMYSPTGTLSVGFNAQVRMKSVAIDVVKRHELDDIKVYYSVAVLIEQYLETRDKNTLLGCCSIRLAPVPEPWMI